MEYSSTVAHNSRAYPGVSITLRRISFGGRNELMRTLSPLATQMKALAASKDEAELAASGALRREMAAAIVDWGVVDVSGLVIDGVPASKELLLSSGPEALVLEIVGELQKQLSLSEDERKN